MPKKKHLKVKVRLAHESFFIKKISLSHAHPTCLQIIKKIKIRDCIRQLH